MSTVVVRQAVLSDLEALALLFDGYRQFYGRASDTHFKLMQKNLIITSGMG